MIGLSKHINLLKENDAVHFLFDGVMDMKIREVYKNKKQFIAEEVIVIYLYLAILVAELESQLYILAEGL